MVGGIGAANTLQDLPELLASFGEAPALISFNAGVSRTLTFTDLVERARTIAKALQDRGVGAGEPIGILAPNGPLWVTACLAILGTGAAVAPIDAQQTKEEQARLLKMIRCRFFLNDLTGSGVGRQDCSLTSPLITEFPILYSFSLSPGLEQTVKAAASHVARPSDLALIVHTPGATGTPKAVPLSHANILSNLSALAAAGVAGPSERAFMPLPLYHIYPLVVGLFLPLSTGGSVVLPGGFSGPEFAHALRSGGATALIGVPRLYESFLAMIKGRIDAQGGVSAWVFHRLLNLSVALARRGQRSFGQLAFKAVQRKGASMSLAARTKQLCSRQARKSFRKASKPTMRQTPAIEEIGILVETGKLVGFVVPSQSAQAAGTPESAEAAVHDALTTSAALLPGYMQLSGFALSRHPLPRSETGKLQRHLLPALYRNAKIIAESHAASQAVTEADRMLLADPAAHRVWTWLEARFAGQRLSLDMNPTLDLGLDSLDWMTITMELEQAFGIVLDQPTASLRDLVAIASRARQQLTPAEEVLPPEPGIFSRAGWYAVNATNRLILRSLFRLRVRGLEYLPDRAPYLICPNHLSYLDPPALASALPWPVLRQTYWAGSADIMFSSGWRRALSRRGRVLAVDPALGVRGGLALSEAALRRGNILVWFPEGWRSWDGTLMPFLPGIGVLLQKTPVPVVPVYIQGTFEAWPRQHRFPYPHPVSVRFGHPLDPKQWASLPATKNAEVEIALAVRESVAALGKG